MEAITQRRVSANETTRPATTAPVSPFHMARQVKEAANVERKTRAAPSAALDLDSLTIRKGVPMPEMARGVRGSKYKELLDKMQPGDSVVLPTKQAHCLMAASKKLKVKAALRALGDGTAGVWKL